MIMENCIQEVPLHALSRTVFIFACIRHRTFLQIWSHIHLWYSWVTQLYQIIYQVLLEFHINISVMVVQLQVLDTI